jgi:hypothetical protein
MHVTLKVSIGEAFDKLSILRIKERRIADQQKLLDIRQEADMIEESLRDFSVYNHYINLRTVNGIIWDLENELRASPRKGALQTIQIYNDARFRIKNKINTITDSTLKEHKSYAQKKALFFSHQGTGDLLNLVGAIRYLTLFYDEVKVVILEHMHDLCKSIFRDDPAIVFHLIKGNHELAPHYGHAARKALFEFVEAGYDLKLSGSHSPAWDGNWDLKPSCYERFYMDIGLPLRIAREWGYIVRDPDREAEVKARALAQIGDRPYIFVHDDPKRPHRGTVDISSNLFVYHPNSNRYDPAWTGMLSERITDYCALMEGAEELHLLDSSFFCLTQFLDLRRVKVRKVYTKTLTFSDELFYDWDVVKIV